MNGEPLLSVRDLVKRFKARRTLTRGSATVHAVDRVTFHVAKGASLGLVGESGCGKSTVARCLLRLVEPDAGTIEFDGEDVRRMHRLELRKLRQRAQIIFQDPYGSLSPRRTVQQTLSEPLHVHRLAHGKAITERLEEVLSEVGLPLDALTRYPHEFSGGQRQRICIARALVLNPAFIVADEPVSALDVSVQAQILKLLEKLREAHGLSFLLVSHDLGVVRYVCDRVAVMYLGRIVEEGPVPEIFDEPLHPYTRVLRAASPVPDPGARISLTRIVGEIPSALDPPSGCAFHPRCPSATAVCRERAPVMTSIDARRRVACHLYVPPHAART